MRVAGEIDLVTSTALDEALRGVPADVRIVIDLRDVAFLDSTGLGVLVKHHSRVEEAGGTFRVHNPSVPVQRVLSSAGFDHLVDVDPAHP